MKRLWLIGLFAAIAAVWLYPVCFHSFLAWQYGGEFLGDDGVLFQSKENSCGPASLAMIYCAYGIDVSEEDIEHSVEMTSDGTTMLELNEEARRDGLCASGWRLTLAELERCQFPVIVFVRGSHFVVADSLRGKNVYLRDPAIGRLKVPEKNFTKIWNGETLVFCRK